MGEAAQRLLEEQRELVQGLVGEALRTIEFFSSAFYDFSPSDDNFSPNHYTFSPSFLSYLLSERVLSSAIQTSFRALPPPGPPAKKKTGRGL